MLYISWFIHNINSRKKNSCFFSIHSHRACIPSQCQSICVPFRTPKICYSIIGRHLCVAVSSSCINSIFSTAKILIKFQKKSYKKCWNRNRERERGGVRVREREQWASTKGRRRANYFDLYAGWSSSQMFQTERLRRRRWRKWWLFWCEPVSTYTTQTSISIWVYVASKYSTKNQDNMLLYLVFLMRLFGIN